MTSPNNSEEFDPKDYANGLPGDGEEPIDWEEEWPEEQEEQTGPDDAEMARIMDEVYQEECAHEREMLRKALEMGLRSDTGPLIGCDDEWPDMPQWERWFHYIKAVFCFAFEWRPMQQHHGSYPDEVDIATPYSRQDGYGWDSETAVVGKGFFRNWFITVRRDGDCWY